jgi:gamma-tubulin complex component 2
MIDPATSVRRNKHVGPEDSSFTTETPFARAPLNSRVSSTSAIQVGRGKTRQDRLDRIPVDIQEALILEDLLYILTVPEVYKASHA